MWNGEYCTIAAEIDANLNTYYIIKVGQTVKYLNERANVQRLKLVWGHKKPVEGLPRCRIPCEGQLLRIARKMFGDSKIDYKAGGYTEMFGTFVSAREANDAAWDLLDAAKRDPQFAGDEFWEHPQAVARSQILLRAA